MNCSSACNMSYGYKDSTKFSKAYLDCLRQKEPQTSILSAQVRQSGMSPDHARFANSVIPPSLWVSHPCLGLPLQLWQSSRWWLRPSAPTESTPLAGQSQLHRERPVRMARQVSQIQDSLALITDTEAQQLAQEAWKDVLTKRFLPV